MKQKFNLTLLVDENVPIRIERAGNVLRVMEGDYILAMIQIDRGQGAMIEIEGFQTFRPILPEGYEPIK